MKAFTIAETLVVIAILGTVGITLSNMIVYFYRSNTYLLEQTSAVDSANRGLDRAYTSVREASYGEDGSYPVASAATSTVTFYSDVDSDGPVEMVRLYLSGETLYRGVTNAAGNPPTYVGQTEAVTTISTAVKNATSTPLFRYYNVSGAELTGTIDITQVRSVRTRIDVDLNPSRAPNIVTLERTATLRNLRN
jgi:type II secretory pathway pseudopilin PulG